MNTRKLKEDGSVPTMSAGSGHVAGIGVGANGEPGVNLKARKKQTKPEFHVPQEMVSGTVTESQKPIDGDLWAAANAMAQDEFPDHPTPESMKFASDWYVKHGGEYASNTAKNESAMVEDTEPCWDDYEMVGMKTKDGKDVPNCVPKNEENTPTDREWGTDSSVEIYKRDTPGELAEAVSLVELLSLAEAWQKITTCQQCKKKLSPREVKLGYRICDSCVSKNGGRVWGKDSDDDDIEEDVRWNDGFTEDCGCGQTNVDEALRVPSRPISRVVVDYMHGKPGGSMAQTRSMLAVSNLTRPQARSESAVLAFLRKKHPKEEIILLNVDFLDAAGKPIGESMVVEEAEYEGRTVELNKPFRTPDGPKKFSVYVKNDKDNVVKVNFGDPNMEIKRDDPDRRKAYRDRHNCDNPGPKWKAEYWSCKWGWGDKKLPV